MALDANARTQAIYNAVLAANPSLGAKNVSDDERASVMAQLKALFGTDTAYLTSNAVIQPGTLYTPQGAVVAVAYPSGAGSVTGPSSILLGTGRLS